ncbi:MAG: hypothetical protein K0Q84_468 [Arthrobacter sp.]|nr:hypothetical protein [Arthrobacter sp.]
MGAEVHHSKLDFPGLKFRELYVPLVMLPGRSTTDCPLGAPGNGRSA